MTATDVSDTLELALQAANLDEVSAAYQQAVTDADLNRTAVWAGESVDFVNAVRPVSQILQEMCDDAEPLIDRRV